ncbi:Phosphatidylinositol transfer protein (PITP) [Tilletia horrida]|nr:Phosphatidylinositol transfer protein (PITP) [Tilletia horrida]
MAAKQHHTIGHGAGKDAQQQHQHQHQEQQQPRGNMLTRAFNSLQLGGGGGHHRKAATSITSPKFYQQQGEGNGVADSDTGSLGRRVSALSQQQQQQQKELHAFTGVFPHPAPGCSPTEPPPQHSKLTAPQQQKYDAMLEHFSRPNQAYPVSTAAGAEKREMGEWETCRLLTRESLLRYLRASKWDLATAKRRLTDTIVWRREYGVDSLDPDELEPEAESGKETVLGFDKRGRPLHYMTPHLNNTKESPRQMKFAVWILERCIDLMPPGVEQLALLINFQHKSRNPTSIANAKLMLYILQNHYVERLGIALCINVPWIFKTFFAAIQPFIDPVTREKCKFDEAIKQEVPLDQLNSDYGGNVDPKYEHDKYWPDLVRTCDRLREKQLDRFRTLCDSKVGASEWVIRGGDPDKAPGTVIVPTTTNETARGEVEAKDVNVEEKEASAPAAAAAAEPQAQELPSATSDASATAGSSVRAAADQAASAASTLVSTAAESAKGLASSTADATASVSQAAMPVLGSLVGLAQAAAQTAVQTVQGGAGVAEGVVARLAGGVAAEGGAGAGSQAQHGASASASAGGAANGVANALKSTTPAAPHPIHAEDLARAPPADVVVARPAGAGAGAGAGAETTASSASATNNVAAAVLLTPTADKLLDGTPVSAASPVAVAAAPPAPAMQGEHDVAADVERGRKTAGTNVTVTVLYFAAARSAAGVASVQIGLPCSSSSPSSTNPESDAFSLAALPALLVQDARHRFAARHCAPSSDHGGDGDGDDDDIDPDELERVLRGSQLSVDHAMVDEEEWGSTVLRGGEEVGVIPPVSGG